MTTNPVFDNPAAFRAAKKATRQATEELNATPRHMLDPGNPNHPSNFDIPAPLVRDIQPLGAH